LGNLSGSSSSSSLSVLVAVLSMFAVLAMFTVLAVSSTASTTSTASATSTATAAGFKFEFVVEFTSGRGFGSRGLGSSFDRCLSYLSGSGGGSSLSVLVAVLSVFTVLAMFTMFAVATTTTASTATASSTAPAAGLEGGDGLNFTFDNLEFRGFELTDIVIDRLLANLEFHVSITGNERIRVFVVVSENTGRSNDNSGEEREGC